MCLVVLCVKSRDLALGRHWRGRVRVACSGGNANPTEISARNGNALGKRHLHRGGLRQREVQHRRVSGRVRDQRLHVHTEVGSARGGHVSQEETVHTARAANGLAGRAEVDAAIHAIRAVFGAVLQQRSQAENGLGIGAVHNPQTEVLSEGLSSECEVLAGRDRVLGGDVPVRVVRTELDEERSGTVGEECDRYRVDRENIFASAGEGGRGGERRRGGVARVYGRRGHDL
nr:hypothetical protein [Nitrosomonas nitrosa]